MKLRSLFPVLVIAAGCALPPEGDPPGQTSPQTHVPAVVTAVMMPAELDAGLASSEASEETGEAADPSTAGTVVGGICAMLTGLGCYAAIEACLGATAMSIGSLAIPCGIAVIGACIGGAACMSAIAAVDGA